MSRQLISRSWDLQKLQNEGYELEVRSGLLLVKGIPYVNSRKEVKRGTLVSKLVLAGDKTAPPDDHVAYFAGEHPCNVDGTEIAGIWPTSDIDPETLDTNGPVFGDAANHIAALIKRKKSESGS